MALIENLPSISARDLVYGQSLWNEVRPQETFNLVKWINLDTKLAIRDDAFSSRINFPSDTSTLGN